MEKNLHFSAQIQHTHLSKFALLLLIVLAFLFTDCSSTSRALPVDYMVEVVPFFPSFSHGWVGGHYGYKNNRYVWFPGSYRRLPKERSILTPSGYHLNRRGAHMYRYTHKKPKQGR